MKTVVFAFAMQWEYETQGRVASADSAVIDPTMVSTLSLAKSLCTWQSKLSATRRWWSSCRRSLLASRKRSSLWRSATPSPLRVVRRSSFSHLQPNQSRNGERSLPRKEFMYMVKLAEQAER
ncbi:hypothetical protein E2542_SST02170 [Spatholobus suberectus]|nr:hypothetical protein E2542_SST02170 [Spatholobus suberectus]